MQYDDYKVVLDSFLNEYYEISSNKKVRELYEELNEKDQLIKLVEWTCNAFTSAKFKRAEQVITITGVTDQTITCNVENGTGKVLELYDMTAEERTLNGIGNLIEIIKLTDGDNEVVFLNLIANTKYAIVLKDESNNVLAYGNITTKENNWVLVFHSDRKKGFDKYPNQANDMKTNDYTKEQLLAINQMFKYQLGESNSPDSLFTDFKIMATTLFSKSEMESVILDMINHFKEGNGADYSNETLTEQVKEHPTTKAYIKLVKDAVINELKNKNGKLYLMQFNESTKETNALNKYIQRNARYPAFNSWADTLGGLKITINDTWGNNVEVRNYTVVNNKFSGTLYFTIYDHFGLDQPDVEKAYVNLAGFRAWYVLQHYDKFKGRYKPFATVMEIDVPFEGEIN